jgi:hypothetical protein
MKPNLKIIRRLAAAVFLLAVLVPCAPAQSTDDDDERSECERAVGLGQKRCEDETDAHENAAAVLEALGLPAQVGEARLPLAQMREDLGYLRTVTDYLSNAASQGGELNFKAIARSASEIEKRAGRLKDGLVLPAPEGGRGARG